MTVIIPVAVIAAVLAWLSRPRSPTDLARRTAILITTLPPAVIAMTALLLQIFYKTSGARGVSEVSNVLFILGLCLIVIAFLVLVGFILARELEIARGVVFGFNLLVILTILEFISLEALAGA